MVGSGDARSGEASYGEARHGRDGGFGRRFLLERRMLGSAELITAFEECPRKAWFSLRWKKYKLTSTQMLQKGVAAAVAEKTRKDWGELAGEIIVGLGAEPGLISEQYDVYSEVIHLASMADVVSCAIRRPGDAPWRVPDAIDSWEPSNLFMSPDGSRLRRIVFSTSWSKDKHYSLCRSWHTMGPICHYQLPMQMIVIITGQHREGRYHSYWCHGLRHPVSKQLRFRKKQDKGTPFKASWIEIWRPDFDDISTEDWIAAMAQDEVLPDICFKVDVEVPPEEVREKMVALAEKKMDTIYDTKAIPDIQYSGCDWPTKCNYLSPCHANLMPSGKFGFVRVDQLIS